MKQTAKQKAEELIRKYYSFGLNNVAGSFSWYECKKFALFTVDECIELHFNLESDTNGIGGSFKYWLEVKEELINWKNE